MCIGVPAKILATGEDAWQPATVEIGGIRRSVNITMVCEGNPQDLVGKWVLVHVGFAMSLLAEDEANEMLTLLDGIEGIATTRQ